MEEMKYGLQFSSLQKSQNVDYSIAHDSINKRLYFIYRRNPHKVWYLGCYHWDLSEAMSDKVIFLSEGIDSYPSLKTAIKACNSIADDEPAFDVLVSKWKALRSAQSN